MKGSNPWIPIADLLAGFVLIFLLMFTDAALRVSWLAAEAEKERVAREEAEAAQVAAVQEQREAFFARVEDRLGPFEELGLVRVRPATMTVELTDLSFPSGSACLDGRAADALTTVGVTISSKTDHAEGLTIFVEGHTDPVPVGGLIQGCGYFDNNFQLSSLRAANARAILLESTGPDWASRLAVAGYGDTRLRDTDHVTSSENRRVELRFVWTSEM